MEIEIVKDKAATIVHVSGRLNASSVGTLEEHLRREAQEGGACLILDLSQLEYISSAGLRVLLLVGKQMKVKGAYMALCGLNSGIQQVFKISGFFPLFNTFDSLDAALRAVSSKPSED